MSRLWSRFGVRAVAVALLGTGVAGGYYLGEDREAQQEGQTAQLAAQVDQVELDYLRQRQANHQAATAAQRVAEHEARRQAAEAAKAAAERAREAEAAASRKAREKAEAEAEEAEAKEKAERETEEADDRPYDGPIPQSCEEYSGNREIGCAILLDSGFDIDQMPCLDKLWTKESRWNSRASNPSSGAYGIPQALPGSKMASAGDDWRTNPATQIKWGLGYIDDRYGTPCSAWRHSQDVGWY